MTIQDVQELIRFARNSALTNGVAFTELDSMHFYINPNPRKTDHNIPYNYDQVGTVLWGVHGSGEFEGEPYLVIGSA